LPDFAHVRKLGRFALLLRFIGGWSGFSGRRVEDGAVQGRPGDSEAGGYLGNRDVGSFEQCPDGLDLFGRELGWATTFSTASTRRYEFVTEVRVIDLGLRLSDVKKCRLQSEAVQYRTDPTFNLEENGATAKEIEFLYRGPHYGQRVELNAFTSDQFVEWLDAELAEHGVEKVVPDEKTLEQAYRRAAAIRRYQKLIDHAGREISAYANDLIVPKALKTKLARKLAKTPASSWDEVLWALAGDGERSL